MQKKQKARKKPKPNQLEKRDITAQTTVSQWRLPIFGATLRTEKVIPQMKFESQYGYIAIKKAILTQIHRNILDAIFTIYEGRSISNEGDLTLYFNVRKLFKTLNVCPSSHEWLKEKLDELMVPKMVIHATHMKRTVHTVILTEHSYSEERKREKWKFRDGELYFIRLSRGFFSLFFFDLPLRFEEEILRRIVTYKNGVIQSFVRFVLTHRKLNCKIEDILKAINISNERYRKNIVSGIKKRKQQLEDDFGIKIQDDFVHYTQHCKIFIDEPVSTEFLPAIKNAGKEDAFLLEEQSTC